MRGGTCRAGPGQIRLGALALSEGLLKFCALGASLASTSPGPGTACPPGTWRASNTHMLLLTCQVNQGGRYLDPGLAVPQLLKLQENSPRCKQSSGARVEQPHVSFTLGPTEVPPGPWPTHLQPAQAGASEIHTLTWKTQVGIECTGWRFTWDHPHHFVFIYIRLHPGTCAESDFPKIAILGGGGMAPRRVEGVEEEADWEGLWPTGQHRPQRTAATQLQAVPALPNGQFPELVLQMKCDVLEGGKDDGESGGGVGIWAPTSGAIHSNRLTLSPSLM